MANIFSVSRLRANLYRVLDRVLETGVPAEVERKGRRLRIVPAETGSRLARLKPHAGYLATDPEELVHLDWSGEWRP
ncbi:MAG: type II toxin-antitoxin system Phd/YefM family antitoxin [Gemmatimonadota bacterium]